MDVLILVVHVIAAFGIIGLVLLQHGKGADMGAAFGSGSAGSLFGSSGAANFLSRATGAMAAVFFVTSLGLTVVATKKTENKGVMTKDASSQPVDPAQSQTLPAQIPSSPLTAPAPAPVIPVPGSAAGSKAGDVPK